MSSEAMFIKKIVEANKNDRLAIFAGAGVSKSCDTEGNEMPSWGDLIKKIEDQINVEKNVDYLKTAQYFYNAVGEEKYYRIIEKQLQGSFIPSKVYERIFDINPHVIITTNWDSIFEDANQRFLRFYDTISNDRELVDSIFHHKIIKMHGDFSHRNIVFKEEDYLSYEHNFPLISNYIKSIISTHTILFLGYSYNDVNLKLIIQWLRNNTKVKPDMYLTAFKSNSNEKEYLKQYGIETIVLSNINNKLDGINDINAIESRWVYTFLDKIFKGYDPQHLENTENVIDFVYERIKPLEPLDGILLDQIQKLLTNCGFEYDDDGLAILKFYNAEMTFDYNREIRDVYLKFLDELDSIANGEKRTEVLLRLFVIFAKAGIKGIFSEKNRGKYTVINCFLGDNNEHF